MKGWSGKKPDVLHLREFGCDVWVLDEDKTRSKLMPKSKKMMFVGFEDSQKVIQYYNAGTRRIKVSCNYVFNENNAPTLEVKAIDLPGLTVEEESGTPTDHISPNPSDATSMIIDSAEKEKGPEATQPETDTGPML